MGGRVGESDSQQPAALDLGRLRWLSGIEMELIFQSNLVGGTDGENSEISPENAEIEIRLFQA